MPRSTLLLSIPLFAASYVASLASASCGMEGSNLPAYDPYGWNDSSVDPTGTWSSSSGGAPSSGSSGGSGVGGGDPSNSSSGGATSSGGSSSRGSSGSSGGSSGSSPGPSDGGASDVYIGYCGSGNCDYHSSTCCLPGDAGSLDAAYCVKGINYACGANIVTYHCLGQMDCPTGGQVCCGVYDTMALTAGTECQTGPCANPQFCLGDPECAGPKCTAQSCQGVSPLYLCGLQSGPPYSCTAVTP